MAIAHIHSFGVPIKGIIHVGANRGQEIEEYARETDRAVLIEPIPQLIEGLKEKVRLNNASYEVLEACCSDRTGEKIVFNVTGGGGDSSSMFGLGRHKELYPSVSYVDHIEMETVTLDDLLARAGLAAGDYNILVIDTQGADLKVLQGAEETIRETIDFIYVEVARTPLYEGGCTLREIEAFLDPLGFSLRHLNINIMDWGNALFGRNALLFEQEAEASLARNGAATQSSTHASEADFGAANAVNGDFRQVTGSRTKLQDQAWWQIDLGAVRQVSHCYWLDRRRRMQPPHPTDVRISDDGESWETVATLEDEEKRSSTALIKRIDLDRPTRFIRLQAQGRHSISVSQFYAMP